MEINSKACGGPFINGSVGPSLFLDEISFAKPMEPNKIYFATNQKEVVGKKHMQY